MRSLFISLHSEFYKSRKSLAFWASVILPVVICGLVAFGSYSAADRIVKINLPPIGLWFKYMQNTIQPMGLLILPFYVIFMAFSVNNIEHKNDTWKTLFSQPLNKFSIYAAKFLYGVLLIFICLFLFGFLTWISGFILNAVDSRLKFNDFSPGPLLRDVYVRLFLASLGIFAIQFVLSLVWSDFLKPMGIGFICTIMGIITTAVGWKYAYLVPYSSPSGAIKFEKLANPADGITIFTEAIWVSLAYAAILFVAGYFILAKRNIK